MLCIVFPVFAVWLSVHSILVSMNFPLKEPVSSRVYEVLLEAAANWGICSVGAEGGGGRGREKKLAIFLHLAVLNCT